MNTKIEGKTSRKKTKTIFKRAKDQNAYGANEVVWLDRLNRIMSTMALAATIQNHLLLSNLGENVVGKCAALIIYDRWRANIYGQYTI